MRVCSVVTPGAPWPAVCHVKYDVDVRFGKSHQYVWVSRCPHTIAWCVSESGVAPRLEQGGLASAHVPCLFCAAWDLGAREVQGIVFCGAVWCMPVLHLTRIYLHVGSLALVLGCIGLLVQLQKL